MIEVAVQGFLLGLATGHICLATCGSIYLSMLLIKGGSLKDGFTMLMQITAGRFITYALFGIVAGFSGALLPDNVRTILAGLSYLVITVLLLKTAFEKSKASCNTGCGTNKMKTANPVLMGAVMGLSLCPSFLLALIRAVDLSGPIAGLVLFTAFFASTTLYILPLSIIGEIGRSPYFQKAAKVAAAGVAIWCLVQAWPYMKKSYEIATISTKTISVMSEKNLYVTGFMGIEEVIISKKMASLREGPVLPSGLTDIPNGSLLICDGPLYEKNKKVIEELEKNECCIIVMDRTINEALNDADVHKMASFLSDVNFIKHKGKGFIYHLPLSAIKKRV